MPFQRRNLRQSIKKRKREEFFKEFPKKAQKRFEHVAQKMKKLSLSPFSISKVSNIPSSTVQKNSYRKQNTHHLEKNTRSKFFQYPRHTTRTFFIALIIIIVFWGIVGMQLKDFLKDVSKKDFVNSSISLVNKTLGAKLKVDGENRTNILLLGSGGETHEGGYLTDSIIVVSLNHNKKSISLFSIPRDLYVTYKVGQYKRKGKINALFRDGINYWKFRSKNKSEIFANSSIIIKDKVEEIIGSEIHYTTFVDFQGFIDIVDELGGITVNVEKDIYDTQYPGPNYSFKTFSLHAGVQLLDGNTALKYVRSRHGNSGGDFGRSRRQKKALLAIKEKAFEQGIFSNPQKLKNFLNIIQSHFWTNLSIREIISVIDFVKDISQENIISVGITDDAENGIGGFLYTPPRDEIEHRMSVFLPYLSGEVNPFAQIQFYWENISSYPELFNNSKTIEIYNTTSRRGIASKTSQNLLRYGIVSNIVKGNNITLREETTLEYISTPENEKIAKFLQRKLDIKPIPITKSKQKQNINQKKDKILKTLSSLNKNTFRIFLGKDFNTSPYTGTIIRRPLQEQIEENQEY